MSSPVNQFCYLAGILLFFLALTEILRLTAIRPRSCRTTAVITKIFPPSSENNSRPRSFFHKHTKKGTGKMAYVTYCVDGRNYFSKTKIPVPADKDVGSRIPIRYARLFPDTLLESASYGKLLLPAVFSLLFFTAGFLL